MPPEKRFQHSLKVSLSDFEYFVLQWLQQTLGDSMADLVRQAVIFQAARLPAAIARNLRAAAEIQAQTIADPDARRLFDNQLERALHVAAATKKAAPDLDISETGVGPIAPHSSSAADFPEDL